MLPVLKEEACAREIKRVKTLMLRSGIKRIKRFEDFDWKFNPHMPRNEIMAFNGLSWNIQTKNLVVIGPSGVGKSHLATAICYSALQKGIPTAFITCSDLVDKLKRSANLSSAVQKRTLFIFNHLQNLNRQILHYI